MAMWLIVGYAGALALAVAKNVDSLRGGDALIAVRLTVASADRRKECDAPFRLEPADSERIIATAERPVGIVTIFVR